MRQNIPKKQKSGHVFQAVFLFKCGLERASLTGPLTRPLLNTSLKANIDINLATVCQKTSFLTVFFFLHIMANIVFCYER